MSPDGVSIERIEGRAYTVPTDAPEADGTFAWERTTAVIVEVSAGGRAGLGYTYSSATVARAGSRSPPARTATSRSTSSA